MWLDGELGNERKLSAQAFDVIFGGILDDSDVYFDKFRDADDSSLPQM